ncbi:phosphatase PAP2 family protein, partial [Desulfovibrio sp. OttesenSCG-928-G11]|nr:phosphatase PAP2 family protein [Desulfovibrio sp. OttesenSCG-928-G11]
FVKKIAAILALNLFGAALLASFLLPYGHEIWRQADGAIFLFFNRYLQPGSFFLHLAAISNVRAFDAVSLLFMGALYLHYFRRAGDREKGQMIAVGLFMLATAIIIKQCDFLYPIAHPSPTRHAWPVDINRISLLTGIGAKDSAANSFPGDHGMMLMIFTAFMARYHGRRAFALAALITVVFAMPRIAGGAHWFSDVYMGSLAVVCLVCPWLLLTPLSLRLPELIRKRLPARFFSRYRA